MFPLRYMFSGLPKALLPAGLLLSSAEISVVNAQNVKTSIERTAGKGDLGTIVSPPIELSTGAVYEITGGERPNNGPNLFHSFDQFTIGSNDTARFSNDSGLTTENILSRVTGGTGSKIYGDIQANKESGFPGANVFLFNPAGVIFGPGASLNVEGSFYVSTADFLRFKSNGGEMKFFADPARESSLTTAAVQAFGFLRPHDNSSDNPSPASIEIDQSELVGANNETLTIVGGDVAIQGSYINAPGGQLIIASVASPGEAILSPDSGPLEIDVGSFADLGKIVLSDSTTFDVTGFNGSGTVLIRAGSLIIKDESSALAYTVNANSVDTAIDINVSDTLDIMNESALDASTFGSGNAGNIVLSASTLDMDNSANIRADTHGKGNAGDIRVNVEEMLVERGSRIESTTRVEDGVGGTVDITAKNLFVAGRVDEFESGLLAETIGMGDAGGVIVTAQNVKLANGAAIRGKSRGEGRSADITIKTNQLELKGGAQISNETLGSGQAGTLRINTNGGTVTLSNVETEITSETLDNSDGGEISITTGHLTISNDALITASTSGTGKGGTVNVRASGIDLINGGQISARSDSDNPNAVSGNVTVRFDDTLRIFDNSSISVETLAADAGDILINLKPGPKGSLLHLRDGTISTTVRAEKGSGGNISIDPVFTILEGGSKIIANAFDGPGGNIRIVTDYLFKSPDSVIDASSAQGIDGSVEIDSPDTDVISGALELAETFAKDAAILGERCAARLAKESSSFVLGSQKGMPPSPETMISSSLLDTDLLSVPSKDTKNLILPGPNASNIVGLEFSPITIGCVIND